MYDLAKELELEKYGSFILSFNGSIITNCKSGEHIFEESLTKEDLHLMYDFAKENSCHILTYVDDEIISEIDSDITPHYIMIIFIAIVVFTLWTLA